MIMVPDVHNGEINVSYVLRGGPEPMGEREGRVNVVDGGMLGVDSSVINVRYVPGMGPGAGEEG